MFNNLKIKYSSILIFILIIFTTFYGYQKYQKKKSKGTYLKYICRTTFNNKLKNAPSWMDEQIKYDLKSCSNLYISPNSISITYKTILENLPDNKKDFIRFRIFNNNLYMYVPKNMQISKIETAFEKALRSLTKLKKMPDLDILYSDQDGTPFSGFFKDFYKTKNLANQAPLFSRAKLKNADFVILIPDYHSLSNDWLRDINTLLEQNKKHPWGKKISKVIWRGYPHKPQRFLLCDLSLKNPALIDAGFSGEFSHDFDNKHYLKNYVSMVDQLNYKYLPVMDGFMCTYNGYQWRLMSNSLALKHESDEIQWFYIALKPYIHYLPIKNDLCDLLEKINWAINNDEKCKKIAENATDFILNNLTLENVYVYLYKVLFEYAKLQNFDKNDFAKEINEDSSWINIQKRKKANKNSYKIN
jgi:hypothetical protein